MPIAFDITGDIGMFRRPYTTTSSVSYPFPPPTAVGGMLGALLGESLYDVDDAKGLDLLKGTSIAIRILSPVRWHREAINLTNVKRLGTHMIVQHQFVRDPSYRVYVSGGAEKDVKRALIDKRGSYPLCMGVAYAMAEVVYKGELKKVGDTDRVHTVIPVFQNTDIDIDREDNDIFTDIMPWRLDKDRTLRDTVTVLWSPGLKDKGLRILGSKNVDKGEYSAGKDLPTERIAWFQPW